jgi:hypothetical protein
MSWVSPWVHTEYGYNTLGKHLGVDAFAIFACLQHLPMYEREYCTCFLCLGGSKDFTLSCSIFPYSPVQEATDVLKLHDMVFKDVPSASREAE